MPDLVELVQRHTALDESDVARIHALIGEWQLLADLSFADLLLWARTADQTGFVLVAQVRPVTAQTAYVEDRIGQVIAEGRRALVDRAFREGRICREGDPEWGDGVPVREETIPVRHQGKIIAVVARHTNLATARTPSRLELTYLACAGDLAGMVADGVFPFPAGHTEAASSPRAGDGLMRLDADGRVAYASPNAVSAYRRLGLTGDIVGIHLGETTARLAPPEGPVDEPLAWLVSGLSGRAAEVEIESRGVAIRLRTMPLLHGGLRVATLVLLRDVTEVRRGEQALVSKDATIREIHHRVKNNLQTVAALLRMQGRRLQSPEARDALDEAVRRVRAIAVVHDTLSQTLDGPVNFDDVADRLLAMMGELASADGTGSVPTRSGSFGMLPAALATPLSMVLTELVQNAIEHGLGDRSGALGGSVVVEARRLDGQVELVVLDDGVGLPHGFSVATSGGLGLEIVRTLVAGDLHGHLELRNRSGGGAAATVRVPLVPVEEVAPRT
jgi:two-component sensor histidine kinase